MPHPIGSKNREKRSLPERCKATEGAVRGVGLPEGSGIREIRSLLDGKTIVRASRQVQPPQSGPLDKLGDRIGLYGRTGLAGTTGFAGVLDAKRETVSKELLNRSSLWVQEVRGVRSPVDRRVATRSVTPAKLVVPDGEEGV